MKIRPVKAIKKRIRFGRGSARTEGLSRKKKRLKYIAVLPSFVTLMNGACGFIAVVFASRSPELRWNIIRGFSMNSFALSGYMIFLAMIADMLDGRVARLTRTTSSFGGQLDSLSDTVSFGVAPAFLMIKVIEFYPEYFSFEKIRFSILINRSILFFAIFYVMCAVVRLARFNVENEEDESAHMNFAGLPSPAAAGIVVSLVIFSQQYLHGFPGEIAGRAVEMLVVTSLPVITFISGILMVSRIRYPHLANQLLRGKKPLSTLLLLFACGLLVIWNIQLAMVLGFCGFALFGIFRWVYASLFKKRKTLST